MRRTARPAGTRLWRVSAHPSIKLVARQGLLLGRGGFDAFGKVAGRMNARLLRLSVLAIELLAKHLHLLR
jgi:hypothetical protein